MGKLSVNRQKNEIRYTSFDFYNIVFLKMLQWLVKIESIYEIGPVEENIIIGHRQPKMVNSKHIQQSSSKTHNIKLNKQTPQK